MRWRVLLLAAVSVALPRAGSAYILVVPSLPPAPLPYLLGGQSTVIWQFHPAFHSPYQGANSLRAESEDAVSHSYTLYLGARPLPWLEVYVDPEMIRGGGIGDGLGLAAYTNGEVIRNPAAGQDPYVARAFARITVPLGARQQAVAAGMNTIAGTQPVRRIVITGGILAVTDIFDTNRYANNTRTQFMNWTFINNLAYDYAADTRGYSRGVAVEWDGERFAVRGGIFQMPKVANGLDLESDVIRSHGDQVEIEARPAVFRIGATVVRLLAFHNQAAMGNYRNALALAARTGMRPDITLTRRPGTEKWGFGVNLEQPLSAGGDSGLFARFGWADGAAESFAFTEAERVATAGIQLSGRRWRRAADRVALAAGVNDISNVHAAYLGAGGLGFVLGDGRLNRRPETEIETYYLLQLTGWFGVTLDYQFIANPGYNADRGPVSVLSVRAHLEHAASPEHARP